MDNLSFISDICGALKNIKRTGWVMRKIPFPESDADHMHRCAMCALILSQPADPRDNYENNNDMIFHPTVIDTTRLLRMAVTHDLCEALAGDITPFCDPTVVASKHDKEHDAMQAIRRVVGDPLGQELCELWKEYEDQQTAESVYCKDIDKFEMLVQALEYEKEHLQHRSKVPGDPRPDQDSTADGEKREEGPPEVYNEPLRRFYITTNSVMKTPIFRRLDKELRERREAMLKEKGWTVTEPERQK
jgi:putative hydrolase of HD superfamily